MALLFAMLMGIVARGVFRLTLGAQAHQSVYEERARQAAVSGLEYARSQLARQADWKGNSPQGVTISTSSLVVKEVNGNVFGLLIYPDGGKSQFRIRFNFQDGSGGADGLEDPPTQARIQTEALSINNLAPKAPANVPGQTSNFQVSQNLPPVGTVPAHSALVQVEGRAGVGINDLNQQTIDVEPSGYVNTVSLQSVLKVELDEPIAPAVLQSAGDMNLVTVDGVNISSLDQGNPSIRSKQTISVSTPDNHDGSLTMPDGHVYVANSQLQAAYDPNSITVHAESASANLSSMTWEQVSKPSENQAFKLPAGTYVLWPPLSINNEPPANPNGTLRYYPMNYDKYLQMVHNPYVLNGQLPPPGLQGTPLSQDFDEIASGSGRLPNGVKISNDKIYIHQDMYIHPTGNGVKDFALIPLFHGAMKSQEMSGVKTEQGWATSTVKPAPGGNLQLEILNSRVYGPGDMIFKGGSITAQGATLIGEGSLEFNTPTLSVMPGENNISMYFKGDIDLSSFNKTSMTYGQFKVAGIIYSWGDVNIHMGDPNATFDKWGNFTFLGSMVAYGGDPVGGKPGLNNKGAISLTSRAAQIIYDPTTIAQLANPEELSQSVKITSVGSWFRL